MGLWVFLLICGPVTSLLYFPLSTRKQSFRLAPVGVSQASTGSALTTVKERDVLRWNREVEDHLHRWKSAA